MGWLVVDLCYLVLFSIRKFDNFFSPKLMSELTPVVFLKKKVIENMGKEDYKCT